MKIRSTPASLGNIINIFFIINFFFLPINIFFAQDPRIYGGDDISISDAPWIINFEDENGASGSGVILNEEWILTAAHVVMYYSQSQFLKMYAHAGATDFTETNTGQRIQVIQRIKHPSWEPNGYTNPHRHDLALVRLSEPLCFNSNVQPILLSNYYNSPEDIVDPGNMVQIAGWGDSENHPNGTPILQGLELTIIDNEDVDYLLHSICNTLGNDNFDNEVWLSLDQIDGAAKAGPGDSGGPAYTYLPDNTPVLLGINVIGVGECAGYLTLAVNIRPYYNWIIENITSTLCECHSDVFVENGTFTYDEDMTFEGDLIIKTGSQLTVTSKLEFKQTHGITVERGAKLIIDGGTITKASSESNWRGINVLGNFNLPQPMSLNSFPTNSQSGMVIVKNNSKIEWAKTGISTTKPCETWNSEYWGGFVHCENSEFSNCRRAAEFMKYDSDNKSAFMNCIINTGKYGITIWDTDNIEIDNCDFTYLSESAIIAWDAGCNIINGCKFNDNGRGIQAFATSPISSGNLLKVESLGGEINSFENNTITDIEIRTGELYKNARVRSNHFTGAPDGIWLDGKNSINILGNSFENMDFPIAVQNTDFGYNIFQCNDISEDIKASIVVEGRNVRTRSFKNNFESVIADFSLSESGNGVTGSIHPFQGGPNSPAKNCFSSLHDEHIWTLTNTSSFNYFVPAQHPSACDIPQESSSGSNEYVIIATGQPSIDDCDVIPGEPSGTYTYSDYDDLYEQYQDKLIDYNNNLSSLSLYNDLLNIEEEKEKVVSWHIRDAINNRNDSLAEIILNQEASANAKRLLYGLKIQLNNYTEADSILLLLPNTTQDEQWFRLVQEVNLYRLNHLENFVLSSSQDSLLNLIANSYSSERGYARSLLSLLKGEQFLIDFVELERGQISRTNNSEYAFITTYPNPTSDNIQICASQPIEKDCSINIYSLEGRLLKTINSVGQPIQSISIIEFSDGIYLLQMNINGNEFYYSKIVILH